LGAGAREGVSSMRGLRPSEPRHLGDPAQGPRGRFLDEGIETSPSSVPSEISGGPRGRFLDEGIETPPGRDPGGLLPCPRGRFLDEGIETPTKPRAIAAFLPAREGVSSMRGLRQRTT